MAEVSRSSEAGLQDTRSRNNTAQHSTMKPANHTSTSQTPSSSRGTAEIHAATNTSRTPRRPATNYDEAPPGQPGPDLSAHTTHNTKPVFSRGPSMLDGTAVTSAAPTPAGEIPNPMAGNSPATARRVRESHLPDLDVRDADVYGEDGRTFGEGEDGDEPVGEIRGVDGFGAELSRRETERGRRDTTTEWSG